MASDDAFAVISTAAVDVVPRGAALTHANVMAANLTAIAAFGLHAGGPLSPRAARSSTSPRWGLRWRTCTPAAPAWWCRAIDAEEAVRLIDRHRVTHLSDFPPVLGHAAGRRREGRGAGCRACAHVAGLDAPPTIERLHAQTGRQFWTGFGQSETSGFVSISARDRQARRGGPAGAAAQVRLVDDYDREVPVGTPGEILVRGPLVSRATSPSPTSRPTRSATAGTTRVTWAASTPTAISTTSSRKPEKELIKPGGENVYPAEVETVIMQMDGRDRRVRASAFPT